MVVPRRLGAAVGAGATKASAAFSSAKPPHKASRFSNLFPGYLYLYHSLSLFAILLCVAILVLFERLPDFGRPMQIQENRLLINQMAEAFPQAALIW